MQESMQTDYLTPVENICSCKKRPVFVSIVEAKVAQYSFGDCASCVDCCRLLGCSSMPDVRLMVKHHPA